MIAEQHAVQQLHHRNCKQDAKTNARQKLVDKTSREYESIEKQHFTNTLSSLKVKLYASQALLALQQNRTFDIKVVNSSVARHKQVSNQ